LINTFLVSINKQPIRFFFFFVFFRPLLFLQVIWKDSGWGTIIFLAALTAIDPELYAAADVDGASRFQKLTHITLPGIKSTIVVLLILRVGGFLNSGFEQILLLMNALTRSVGEVFDTYIYLAGINNGQFSYTTAVGLFKSVVSLVLIAGANWAAKKMGEEGIY
jgi:putative aldouronate transport system permease protein